MFFPDFQDQAAYPAGKLLRNFLHIDFCVVQNSSKAVLQNDYTSLPHEASDCNVMQGQILEIQK